MTDISLGGGFICDWVDFRPRTRLFLRDDIKLEGLWMSQALLS